MQWEISSTTDSHKDNNWVWLFASKFLCTYHDHNDHKQHEEVHDKCLQKKQIHKKSEHEQSNLLTMSCMTILI